MITNAFDKFYDAATDKVVEPIYKMGEYFGHAQDILGVVDTVKSITKVPSSLKNLTSKEASLFDKVSTVKEIGEIAYGVYDISKPKEKSDKEKEVDLWNLGTSIASAAMNTSNPIQLAASLAGIGKEGSKIMAKAGKEASMIMYDKFMRPVTATMDLAVETASNINQISKGVGQIEKSVAEMSNINLNAAMKAGQELFDPNSAYNVKMKQDLKSLEDQMYAGQRAGEEVVKQYNIDHPDTAVVSEADRKAMEDYFAKYNAEQAAKAAQEKQTQEKQTQEKQTQEKQAQEKQAPKVDASISIIPNPIIPNSALPLGNKLIDIKIITSDKK